MTFRAEIKRLFVTRDIKAFIAVESRYKTIKIVALEGEGSNCFSITQLVGLETQ